MKIVGFVADQALRIGIVDGDQVVDLQQVDGRIPVNLADWLAANGGDLRPLAQLARDAPAAARRPLVGLTYGLPVARPGKVVCLGLNYLEHAKEGGHQKPEFPTIFMRCQTSLVSHREALMLPLVSDTFDYEAELAVVIGRKAKHLSRSDALSCVAGYCCFNDGSIRQFQRRTSQWDMGKNFDRTGGFGPWMISADELPGGAAGLKIESRLNGRVLQSDNTRNMLFSVAETLCDISQAMTLEPGDLIAMGTPSGVGHARKPPLWMRNGDVCDIEIEGIGVLSNPVERESGAATS